MLKQCCDLAEFQFLKQCGSFSTNTSQNERESINNLKYMIEKQWSYEQVTYVKKYTKISGINQQHCP